MLIISHRGNLDGPSKDTENNPNIVAQLLEDKIHVEVDVHAIDGILWLGHDEPTHIVDRHFIKKKGLWVHAKTIATMHVMITEFEGVNAFYHTDEDIVLTTNGKLWTQPGKKLTYKSICVLPEDTNQDPRGAYGICTDYYRSYKGLYGS